MGLKVVTAPTVEPVTLADAKLHARIDGSDEDDLIEQMIVAARQNAEHITERALAPTTFCLYLDAFPAGGVKIPMPPINAISSVQYVDTSGDLQTLDASNYSLDDAQEPAWLLPAHGVDWPSTLDVANAVRVTFMAGYAAADCPAQIKSYMLAVVASLYRQREHIADGSRLPRSVEFLATLLEPYKVGQGFA